MIEVECKQCEGKGRIEVSTDCFQPAWNCCGGCTEVIECPECEGSGEVEEWDEDKI
jgi:DnaJ-class molecular chaperone